MSNSVEELLPLVRALAGQRAQKTNVPFDDLVQEGSVALVEAAAKYEPGEASLKTFVYHRVYWAIHDAAYPNRRTRRPPEVLLEEPIEEVYDGQYEAIDNEDLIVQVVGRLSGRQQEALNLFREGLTFKEIGERMGVSKQRAHGLFKQTVAEAQNLV